PLSQQIQTLEQELGTRLFDRTNRRVDLSESGRLFLDEARLVLAQVDKATDVARRAQLGEIGELKIGFTSSAPFTSSIPQAIFAFRQAYPDVHLTLTEITSQEVAAGLEDKTIQVGIMRPLALPDSLVVFELLNEPLVAIMRADHPLAAESENGIYMSALAAEPFVFFPRTYGSGIYAQVLSLARAAGFSPLITQEAGGSDDHHRPGGGWTGRHRAASVLPPNAHRRRGLSQCPRPRRDKRGVAGTAQGRTVTDGQGVYRAFNAQ
ncbi:LysR family transcriptional regulator, partial [Pseudomonas savastanoi pv. glycinea str. race 4]